MPSVETNLVQCSSCKQVFSLDDIPAAPKGGYNPCPGCDKTATLMPLYTMSDSKEKVVFKRVAGPAEKIVKAEGEYSTRVSLAGLGVPLHFVGGTNTRFEVHIHLAAAPDAKPSE